MRLLLLDDDCNFSLTKFAEHEVPPYAILSHVWGPDGTEVTYNEILDGKRSNKAGYGKLHFCAAQAKKDGLQYFWIDTCCIDKSDAIELQTAINSMFRWYQRAAKCYVFLPDVSTGKHSRSSEPLWESAFRRSQWFTRGWTLQELLAPRSVVFFSRDGKQLGDKDSLELQIHEITGIQVEALRGHLSQFSFNERRLWAANRKTTFEEDQVYCLMGIFGVFLLPNYGESKEYAFLRLKDEINRRSSDTQGNSTIQTVS
jgi:heterokaryon incompatibility protein (HET)